MTKEVTEQIMERVEYLIQHANFYYEQRLKDEPFLKEDYPFLKFSARIKNEIKILLKDK
jgi:hypothetical protein